MMAPIPYLGRASAMSASARPDLAPSSIASRPWPGPAGLIALGPITWRVANHPARPIEARPSPKLRFSLNAVTTSGRLAGMEWDLWTGNFVRPASRARVRQNTRDPVAQLAVMMRTGRSPRWGRLELACRTCEWTDRRGEKPASLTHTDWGRCVCAPRRQQLKRRGYVR